MPECIAQVKAALRALTVFSATAPAYSLFSGALLLFLLPAKSLITTPPVRYRTQPQFVPSPPASRGAAREICAGLRLPHGLDDTLAALNVARYQVWASAISTTSNSRQAVLAAFNGDVYEGPAGRSLSAEDLEWASAVTILSGLYGVLRPLDHSAAPPAGDGRWRLATDGGQHPATSTGDARLPSTSTPSCAQTPRPWS